MAEFILERENANDEDATIVAVHFPSGTIVAKGARVVDVETSKMVQEIEAPSGGIFSHSLTIGARVPFGVPLFDISPESADAAPPLPAFREHLGSKPEPEHAVASHHRSVRATARARELADAAGVNLEAIGSAFVTSEHVKRYLHVPAPAAAERSVSMSDAQLAGAGELLPARKRREIQTLSRGAGATMLSVVGEDVGRIRRTSLENVFFEDKIIDLIIYEASRLMTQYPRLNACYVENDMVRHNEHVHAGVAFDDGSGLVVYAVRDANELSLPSIQERFLEGLEKYAAGSLTSADMSAATYSITDLTGHDVDFVLPLLPPGQSSIIGVTRDRNGRYRLYLGFDHRITEGREAAIFLKDLCDRLRSFDAIRVDENECSFCGGTALFEQTRRGGKGLLRMVGAQGEDLLCCRNCYAGW